MFKPTMTMTGYPVGLSRIAEPYRAVIASEYEVHGNLDAPEFFVAGGYFWSESFGGEALPLLAPITRYTMGDESAQAEEPEFKFDLSSIPSMAEFRGIGSAA